MKNMYSDMERITEREKDLLGRIVVNAVNFSFYT